MNPSIILVGNGTSVMDRELGPTIDSFHTVVRFNDVRIAGYEKHVGTKTDVLATCLKFNPEKLGNLRPCRRIIAHSWQPNPEKCGIFQSYAWYHSAEKMDHAMLREMCDYVGSHEYRAWSTGALTIWLFLKSNERVTIHGFDWAFREQHHYGDKAVRGTLHKPDREQGFIEKLRSEGRVEIL
jgi:hypothetical protein